MLGTAGHERRTAFSLLKISISILVLVLVDEDMGGLFLTAARWNARWVMDPRVSEWRSEWRGLKARDMVDNRVNENNNRGRVNFIQYIVLNSE